MGREPAVCTDGAGGLGVTGWWVGSCYRPGDERPRAVGALVCFVAACLRGRNCCSFCSQQRAPGKVLLDAVCNHLNLVEGDYFGLEFPDHKKITVGDVPETLLFYHLFDLWEGSYQDLSGPDGSVPQQKCPECP